MAIVFCLLVSARSNNWYQSQSHEFDFQWGNCSRGDCCRLDNCLVT